MKLTGGLDCKLRVVYVTNFNPENVLFYTMMHVRAIVQTVGSNDKGSALVENTPARESSCLITHVSFILTLYVLEASHNIAYSGCNFKCAIFKNVSVMEIISISCEIAFRLMPQSLSDDLSISVLVMTWCHQATSHYQNQC